MTEEEARPKYEPTHIARPRFTGLTLYHLTLPYRLIDQQVPDSTYLVAVCLQSFP